MSKHSLVSTQKKLSSTRKALYMAIAAASSLVGQVVIAGPDGGTIMGGSGNIAQSGRITTINQLSNRVAIDWKSFDVASDERVNFIQPDASSIALNRILSHSGSEIHGRIEANGNIILVNPNGILFGRNSTVNVGGMIASGLHIDPNDFMNGEFTLASIEGAEGKVINEGTINAAVGGSVTFVGKQVKNDGLISATLGTVNLAAGNEAVVSFDGNGLLGIKVNKAVLQNEIGLDAAVINTGEINAQGGKILLTASISQEIFSQAVNSDGIEQAKSVLVHQDGTFTLGEGADVVNTGHITTSSASGSAGVIAIVGENVTNSGSIQANSIGGAKGGTIELHAKDKVELRGTATVRASANNQGDGGDIKILGNKVGLFDSAEIDASGAYGGGQILIGGDETGNNTLVRNSDFVYVSEGSSISADAITDGDGGKVITFAQDTAIVHGGLSARAGTIGGNGGFVETSGLKGFELLSNPDVSSN
ncbi:MAG TPA: filamentous hemagglutinin N-terminal domain-containing protein, partial [Niabella sp.]|nr:filamentous hemagglutinin N-terminal domain-containing protein [Niabella sp.]